MFCIYIFNKNVKHSLYHAYFASIHVAVWKQKVYRCCKNSLEKSENGVMLKLFEYWALINLIQRSIFLIISEVREVWLIFILYRLYCFGRLLLRLHCLHMFACLVNLFDDMSMKYAEEFSMKCWIIILVIFYSRKW